MAFSGGTIVEEDRAARLVDAARSLADETGGATFTVSQVAARAGSSLKGFYRCFAGKDELLLALLAAESETGAALLAARLHGPRHDRLRQYVSGILQMAALPEAEGYAAVLAKEHRRLAEDHPEELAAALAPLVDLLADVAGDDAELVFAVVLSAIDAITLGRGRPDELAERVTRFCIHGINGMKGT